MSKNTFEIKEGIKAHFIKTELFKTNLICVMLTVPIEKENVTKNTLIPFLLKRGTNILKDQYQINKKLEEMYGSVYDCGIDKVGDNQLIKFYIESVNDNFLPEKCDILKQSIDTILDIIFNPLMENGLFEEDFLEVEKNNLRKVIESKIDNKDKYAYDNCISAMYKDSGFGIYKYGYIEDLDKITLQDISEHYMELINSAKIDIYISGEINEDNAKDILIKNENIIKLNSRKENYIVNNNFKEEKEVSEVNKIEEKMNISQGKLVMGYDVFSKQENIQTIGLVYNAILGDGANSMMFQNVREKESLAYSARSNYIKQKQNIFVRCGIEIENYAKAVQVIKEQLKNLEDGNFDDKDIENAKKYLISSIQAIDTEQDTQIVFYIGQELSKTDYSIEEYVQKIMNVTKQEIIEFAKTVKLNTIYFLRN
ncbi:MAG: EF-P 5-aminopentanol modification-associated protein YfmF [Candidatus Scatovivens sp.]